MADEADCDYHAQRARAELDWAYRSEHRSASEAHMRLSALHMERVRQIGSDRATSDVSR